MEIFNPTKEQIANGFAMLNSNRIVFESNTTFIHNRADDYIESLNLNGYEGELLGVGVEINNIGYMYAVFDSSQIDISEAIEQIKKHFTNRVTK